MPPIYGLIVVTITGAILPGHTLPRALLTLLWVLFGTGFNLRLARAVKLRENKV